MVRSLTFAQVPVLQVWHAPHAVLQQVAEEAPVETQLLCSHWLFAPAEQVCPSANLGVQVPDAQKSPATQSPSAEQEPVLHAVAEAHTSELGHGPGVGVQA